MDVGSINLSHNSFLAPRFSNPQERLAKLSKRNMKNLSTKVYADSTEMSWQASLAFASAISEPKTKSVILATGNTPRRMYDHLCNLHAQHDLSLGRLTWYHLDDFYGIKEGQYNFSDDLWQNLLTKLQVSRKNYCSWQDILATGKPFHFLDEVFQTEAPDVAVLGIGQNGHIGFNEPGSGFFSCSRKMPLDAQTIQMFMNDFGGKPPVEAIGMGIATILKAKKIILMASGKNKAAAVARMLQGPVAPDCPASFLQLHPNLEVFLDEDAASELNQKKNAPAVVEKIKGKILFCSPHPDDTAISAGGFLYRHRGQVKTINLYSGHRSDIPHSNKEQRIAIRKSESEDEAKILGIESEFASLLGYEQNYAILAQDIEYLANQIESYAPRHIMVPMLNDPHPAHRACRELLFHTLEQLQYTYPLDIWFYETPWGVFGPGEMNTFCALSEEELEVKLKAIRAHESQCSRTAYDEAAKSLAKFRAIVGPEQEFSGFGDQSAEQNQFGIAAECFSRFIAY